MHFHTQIMYSEKISGRFGGPPGRSDSAAGPGVPHPCHKHWHEPVDQRAVADTDGFADRRLTCTFAPHDDPLRTTPMFERGRLKARGHRNNADPGHRSDAGRRDDPLTCVAPESDPTNPTGRNPHAPFGRPMSAMNRYAWLVGECPMSRRRRRSPRLRPLPDAAERLSGVRSETVRTTEGTPMSKRKTAPGGRTRAAVSGGARTSRFSARAGPGTRPAGPEPETTPPTESPARRRASARTRRDRERANAIEAP